MRTDFGYAIACNCSICTMGSSRWGFVPDDDFKLLAGEEVLDQFGRRMIHHLFCKRCGIHSFARGLMPDGRSVHAVNLDCLRDVDLGAIRIAPFDGASL